MFEEEITETVSIQTPASIYKELPADPVLLTRIHHYRTTLQQILHGKDERLAVIVGPCSIHDVTAALAYAELLQRARAEFADTLFIVMRVYFEKPRTTLGWKGFISDPNLDGSFDFNSGLLQARKLLLQLTAMDIPAGTEFLDMIIPQYLHDLISWCAIGARTSASQIHRELASGLQMPVGFKNNTDGNIKIAVDAAHTASYSHHFLSINQQGFPCVTKTPGNPHCHVILRGSHDAPNYARHFVADTVDLLHAENLTPRLMIDCSHGNSMKHASNQTLAARAVMEQIAKGAKHIFGVMLESNLVAGNQKLTKEKILRYGQSITDECISWQDTWPLLQGLAAAVAAR